MHERDDEVFGWSLSRDVSRDSMLDDQYATESVAESFKETKEWFDGRIDTVANAVARVLKCGHLHRLGDALVRCERCSSKAKRAVYVCERCGVTCPVTGQTLCLQCTELGPDGRRYSPRGYKRARRLGLFDLPTAELRAPSAHPALCAPSRLGRRGGGRGLLSCLLEWW